MNFVHWHLVLNHFPLALALFSFGLLQWGVWIKDANVQRAALAGCAAAAALAFLTLWTGDEAAEIAPRLVSLPAGLVKRHEEAAEATLWALGALGAVSALALWKARGKAALDGRLVQAAAALSLLALLLLGWTSYRGGQIRHPEIQPDWKEAGGRP